MQLLFLFIFKVNNIIKNDVNLELNLNLFIILYVMYV